MKKPPYPKNYSGKTIYIKVPEESNGKWFCVCLLETGKTMPQAIYQPYNTKSSCERVCNLHNEFHHCSKSEVSAILKRVGYKKS